MTSSGTSIPAAMLDCSAATWRPGTATSAFRLRATARFTSPPCPSETRAVRFDGSSPSAVAAASRPSSSDRSRKTIGSTRSASAAIGDGRAAIRARRELARLEHGVEGAAAVQRGAAGAGPPHRAPTPDRRRRAASAEDVRERPVGMDPVEDDQVGRELLDDVGAGRCAGAGSTPGRCLSRGGGRRRGSRRHIRWPRPPAPPERA